MCAILNVERERASVRASEPFWRARCKREEEWHRNGMSGTMKEREREIEGDRELVMCTASITCEAALGEVNHQLVHRRCLTLMPPLVNVDDTHTAAFSQHCICAHIQNQQCVSMSWTLKFPLSLLICVQILYSSGLVSARHINRVHQQSWKWHHSLHTNTNPACLSTLSQFSVSEYESLFAQLSHFRWLGEQHFLWRFV